MNINLFECVKYDGITSLSDWLLTFELATEDFVKLEISETLEAVRLENFRMAKITSHMGTINMQRSLHNNHKFVISSKRIILQAMISIKLKSLIDKKVTNVRVFVRELELIFRLLKILAMLFMKMKNCLT